MRTWFVLSAVGTDRKGLVDDVSRFLFERGCNFEDSRMSVLGGEFALMLLASGERAAFERVQADLGALEGTGLTAIVRETGAPAARSQEAAVPYTLRVFSMDHPGIVQQVTRLLREHGVNIEELETRSAPAPNSGASLFSLELAMRVPAEMPLRQLRAALETLADAQNLDVTIEPAKGAR